MKTVQTYKLQYQSLQEPCDMPQHENQHMKLTTARNRIKANKFKFQLPTQLDNLNHNLNQYDVLSKAIIDVGNYLTINLAKNYFVHKDWRES